MCKHSCVGMLHSAHLQAVITPSQTIAQSDAGAVAPLATGRVREASGLSECVANVMRNTKLPHDHAQQSLHRIRNVLGAPAGI